MNTRFQDELRFGEELYDYMIHHYTEMVDVERKQINNFILWYTTIDTMYKYIPISAVYEQEIEQILIPWLQAENQSGRLFERSHWKAFRDPYDFNDIHMGYRYLFPFREYIFQLHLCLDGQSVGTDCPTHSNRASFHLGLYHSSSKYITGDLPMSDNDWDELNPVLL